MKINIEKLADGWGNAEGYVCAFSGTKQLFFSWPEQERELTAWLEANAERRDVYVGWCLFHRPSRKATDAYALPGVLIDLDLNSGKHAKQNYPTSEQEAMAVVAQTALPDPSQVIASGGGLYLYYLFNEPFIIESPADNARAAAVTKGVTNILKTAMAAQGWAIDDVSDLSRVTRPLGARNWKYSDARHVELKSESETRLKIEDYEMLIGAGVSRKQADERPFLHPTDPTEGYADFSLLQKHCRFVGKLRDEPTEVSEPEWYAAATLAAHCDNGDDHFHELSALDATRYDAAETDAKLRHARKVKPRTCGFIADELASPECVRCPFRAADMTSPYKLAFGDRDLLELQSQYVLCAQTDMYHPTSDDRAALPASSFNNHFAHRVAKTHMRFVHDDRSPKVIGTDYIPGDSRLIISHSDDAHVLNEWTFGGLTPISGETGVIDEHIQLILPKKEDRDWVLNYLAHLLQQPDIKIKHGIMLIGDHGVGKSFITEILKALFGDRNVKVDDAAIHASDYRRSLGNTQILVIEEMATSSRWEVTNSLKPWFTSDTVVANEKYIRASEVRTPRGIFIYTNRAIPAVFEPGERRNAVFRIDLPAQNQKYYDRLFTAGIQQLAAFKRDLLDRDISGWSPHGRPPVTTAKADIIEASRTPVATDIQDLVSDGKLVKELATVRDIISLLTNPVHSFAPPSSSKVTKALHEMGARKLAKTKLSNGSSVDLWALRNAQRWLMATHAERKAHYEGVASSSGTVLGIVDQHVSSAGSN
ncbi:DUF5906 domain-containing protein [Oricola nitratireducens]|uniref:DUF5906 domain-containing protein n=1 Tax=Oricola nitratireducens TaxID=2775868 RepID=UPI001866AD10